MMSELILVYQISGARIRVEQSRSAPFPRSRHLLQILPLLFSLGLKCELRPFSTVTFLSPSE